MQGKERVRLITGNELAQNNISDERYNVQFPDKKLDGITKFEKVPVDEERLIKDMEIILQEKMFRDYPAGLTKRDTHPKTLACLQAEFIVEPNIPAELKVGIFAFPQTYPAWIRISSASDDDPSGIATYSQAGAGFGFSALWTAIILSSHGSRAGNMIIRTVINAQYKERI